MLRGVQRGQELLRRELPVLRPRWQLLECTVRDSVRQHVLWTHADLPEQHVMHALAFGNFTRVGRAACPVSLFTGYPCSSHCAEVLQVLHEELRLTANSVVSPRSSSSTPTPSGAVR